jgi:hypothetical protein
MKLSNGRAVSFYELEIGGWVTVYDTRAQTFEIVRGSKP